jgi:hypothetical protein
MAVAWAAVGLMAATVFGVLFYIGSKIDALGARLDSRIDSLSGRVDGLSSRMDGLSSRIDSHLERHAG